MVGWGVFKSLLIVMQHFCMTYVDDLRYGLGRRYRPETLAERQGPQARGVFTLQYPRERLPLPERSRNLPFLVTDAATEALRCTACGICTQVCPSQCIWIERAVDAETGRPLRRPAQYHLDISLCMGCGFCAEFCPFDAIKMDMDYELASYARPGFLDAAQLARPEAYHAALHPTAYAAEQARKSK